MHAPDWYINGVLDVESSTRKLFQEWTAHLPKRTETTPYHSTAPSLKFIDYALRLIFQGKQFTVMETGFCLGHSAEIFLRLGAKKVYSVEISERPETMLAKEIMEKIWGEGAFQFLRPEEARSARFPIDLGFIDGAHDKHSIINDFNLMVNQGAKWVLFDDFWPRWGETQSAMQDIGIHPNVIIGTMALSNIE